MSYYDDESSYDDEGYAEWDDWGEARRNTRRVPTATVRNPTPRPSDRAVTQTQFQVAIQQVNAAISKNSTAIQKVGSSVMGVENNVRRQGRALKSVNRDIGKLAELATIVPLLIGAVGQQNQQLATILPFLYAQDIGKGDGSGSSSGDSGLLGGGSSGLLLLLVLIGGLGSSQGGHGGHGGGSVGGGGPVVEGTVVSGPPSSGSTGSKAG
ncbi:MAG: hypothetical protein ACRCSN_10000 [Dermatophilaceae bacterium]